MKTYRNTLNAFALRLAAAALTSTAALVATPALAESAVQSQIATVNGTRLHYLRAGTGDQTLVLLHGFPQSSHEFARVIPLLAEKYTVIAPDLRGIGGSAIATTGFDKANMARDVHDLVVSLRLTNVVVAGHDIGGMVAYAYGRQFPDEVKGIAILDVPLPGIDPWRMLGSDRRSWHFGFHQEAGVGELLIAGRQAAYFKTMINRFAGPPGTSTAISDADIAKYAKAYGSPAQLKAGMEFYRAFPADEGFNEKHGEAFMVPILLVGGEYSMSQLLPMLTEGLKKLGATNVKAVTVMGSGHWVAEQKPADLVAALRAFMGD